MDWRLLRQPFTLAVLAVAIVAGGCASHRPPAPPFTVRVVHGDTHTSVRVRSGTTVGDLLDRRNVHPRGGQLRAVESGEPLGSNGDAARILVHGRRATRSTALRRAATVEVIDGTDTTEATRTERRVIDPPGLPKAIQYVQFQGRPGLEAVTFGVHSKEVSARTTIKAPVPYHRATGKVVTLTFDDGPSPTWTPPILAILKAKKVQATFCQVGTEVEAHPELTRQIVEQGHHLCNHTEHHVEGLEQRDRATIDAEIAGGRDAQVDAGGTEPAYYRPPGGSLAPVIYDATEAVGESVLYWSVDPRDWKRPPFAELAINVVGNLGPGAIVLLHDGGGDRASTVAALPAIIDFARALGYTFTPPISGRPQVG